MGALAQTLVGRGRITLLHAAPRWLLVTSSQVVYLTSYEHMGRAMFACRAGCSCDGFTLNGHKSHRVSMTELSRGVWVTFLNSTNGFHSRQTGSHGACHLEARVLEGTDSREHKFKVVGLVLQS